MATLSAKPSQHYQLSDWRTNSYLLSTNAERQRDASHQIRQEARILRNETNNQVWGWGWSLSPVGHGRSLSHGHPFHLVPSLPDGMG